MQGEVHFLKNISKLKIGFNEYGPNKMNTFSICNYTTVCELLTYFHERPPKLVFQVYYKVGMRLLTGLSNQ